VILEEQPAGWTPPADAPVNVEDVQFSERSATHVQLDVNTPTPAWLVLVDTYAPGWRATVDQQPAPIYVANHAFRALVVPAGRHTVEFTYAPPMLATGVAVSTGAALVVLALLVWMRFAKQNQGRLP
jgi:uncharacterized membrane protein YfhO